MPIMLFSPQLILSTYSIMHPSLIHSDAFHLHNSVPFLTILSYISSHHLLLSHSIPLSGPAPSHICCTSHPIPSCPTHDVILHPLQPIFLICSIPSPLLPTVPSHHVPTLLFFHPFPTGHTIQYSIQCHILPTTPLIYFIHTWETDPCAQWA